MIEIGCGEPVDLSHSGATRAAGEWIDVLKKTGREIFAFLLRVDPADAVSRIEQRIERDIQDGHKSRGDKLSWLWAGLGLHFLYLAGHETAKFAEIARFSEIELRTSGRTVKETADEIMAKCNLGSQDSLAT